MAHLDVDLSIPIALLVASIVGVLLVRHAISRGERRAKERTRRLIERYGIESHGRSDAGDEMPEPARASNP